MVEFTVICIELTKLNTWFLDSTFIIGINELLVFSYSER